MSDHELYDFPSRRCPDETRLAAFVDGGLEPSDRARLQRHLADCPYCLGQVSALVRLQEADLPEVDPGLVRRARVTPPSETRWQRMLARRWALACVATACLAIMVIVWVRLPRPADKETVRTSYAQGSAPELVLPREGTALKRSAVEFRWTPIERALFYEVRVLTADGDLVWQIRAESTEARPSADITFRSGQNYFVSVSAWLPEGKAARSTVVGFQVTGP
jgi:hypothetical protein